MASESYTNYYFVSAYTPGVSITVGTLQGGGQPVVEQGTIDGSVTVPSADSEISFFGTILGVTEDPRFYGLTPMCAPIHVSV